MDRDEMFEKIENAISIDIDVDLEEIDDMFYWDEMEELFDRDEREDIIEHIRTTYDDFEDEFKSAIADYIFRYIDELIYQKEVKEHPEDAPGQLHLF